MNSLRTGGRWDRDGVINEPGNARFPELLLPSWFLVAVGTALTGYFYLARIFDSLTWLILVLWTLLPYALFALAIRAAGSRVARAAVFATLLASVCYAFSLYFDRRFISFAVVEPTPLDVPCVQLLALVVAWLAIRLWPRFARRLRIATGDQARVKEAAADVLNPVLGMCMAVLLFMMYPLSMPPAALIVRAHPEDPALLNTFNYVYGPICELAHRSGRFKRAMDAYFGLWEFAAPR